MRSSLLTAGGKATIVTGVALLMAPALYVGGALGGASPSLEATAQAAEASGQPCKSLVSARASRVPCRNGIGILTWNR